MLLRTILRTALLALGLCVWLTPASARQVYQGGDLLKNCAVQEVCDAYLSGTFDARATLLTWLNGTHPICPPTKLSTAQIWPTVQGYLQRNPAELVHYASSLAFNAMQQAYRCPAGAAPPKEILDRAKDALELAMICSNPLLCQAFLIGVMDTHQVLVDWRVVPPLTCVPEDLQLREAVLAVLNYIGQHPEWATFSAASMALRALSERYPCR